MIVNFDLSYQQTTKLDVFEPYVLLGKLLPICSNELHHASLTTHDHDDPFVLLYLGVWHGLQNLLSVGLIPLRLMLWCYKRFGVGEY